MRTPFYKCRFCYKFSQSEKLIEQHETSCSYNPEKHHCNSCSNRKLIVSKDESGDETLEYICKKGYRINIRDSVIPCKSSEYKKASDRELKKRSENPEF